jgi:hypothetical protein
MSGEGPSETMYGSEEGPELVYVCITFLDLRMRLRNTGSSSV